MTMIRLIHTAIYMTVRYLTEQENVLKVSRFHTWTINTFKA